MANNFTHTRLPIVCLIFALLLNVDYVTAQEETDITAQTDSTRETTLWYLSNGNMYSTSSASRIGLGSFYPQQKLDINGRLFLRSVDTDSVDEHWPRSCIYFQSQSLVLGTPPGYYCNNTIDLQPGGSSQGPVWSQIRMYSSPTANEKIMKIRLNTEANSYIDTDYNFGVGTPLPQYKLDVKGTIRANEIRVMSSGADFVFSHDYKLMPLDSVEQFVNEHHHLPNISSAQQMQENGVGLGEQQTLLLQKIEELTLYIIEQQKQIENLKIQLQTLTKE